MPIFEYKCQDCRKEFERVVFGSDSGQVPCPQCGSQETKRQLSVFACGGAADSLAGGCGSTPTGGFS